MTRLVSDSFWKLQYRRLNTGLAWCVFGLGGLLLSLTLFSYLRIIEKDPRIRCRKARQYISGVFQCYFRLLDRLDVLSIDVSRLMQLKDKKGIIVIANHPTILDYVAITSCLPQIDCVVKASLRHNFFLKNVIQSADYLSNEGALELIDECVLRLNRGENILVFPEGTRSSRYEPIKLKRGVAHVALRARCDIAVVHIRSSHHWLDKESQWYEIPPVKPSLILSFARMIHAEDFLSEYEDGYSLASRRLTEAIRKELSSIVCWGDDVELISKRE